MSNENRRIYIVSEIHGEEFGLNTRHLGGPFDRATVSEHERIESAMLPGSKHQSTNIVHRGDGGDLSVLVWVRV